MIRGYLLFNKIFYNKFTCKSYNLLNYSTYNINNNKTSDKSVKKLNKLKYNKTITFTKFRNSFYFKIIYFINYINYKFGFTMLSKDDNSISLSPPECVRGMEKLDKSKFVKVLSVPTLLIPGSEISNLMKIFKKICFKVLL